MRRITAGATLAIVVLFGFGYFYWTYVSNQPKELELTIVSESEIDSSSNVDLNGRWVVLQSESINDPDFNIPDHPKQSQVGYRIPTVGDIDVVVGRTPDVNGSILIDNNQLVSAEITVETDKLKSNDEDQDENFRKAINSDKNNQAIFQLLNPVGPITPGTVSLSADVKGTLKLAGSQNDLLANVKGQYLKAENVDPTIANQEVIQVVVTADIIFADYAIELPDQYKSITKDSGKIEVLINFVKAE